MDGFSPPPMSDFSPPPLSDMSPIKDFPPLNGFDPEEDEEAVNQADFDLPINDAEFDLQSLPEKSLEITRLNNLPPKEIEEPKTVEIIINNSSKIVNNHEKCSDDENEISDRTNGCDEIVFEEGKVNDREDPKLDKDEAAEDQTEVLDSCEEQNNLSEYSSESGPAEHIVEESSNEQVCDTTNDGDDDIKEDDIKWANDNIEDDPNDDWGNFEDVGGDNVAESQSWSHLQAEPASAADKPDIEFDESDDDEFGDFGEATTTVPAVEPVRVDPGDESSILKSLELLSVKSEELLRSIFETSVGEEHDDEEEEKDEMNLEKTVLVEVCNSDSQ